MAVTPRKLSLTRDQFASFLQDFEQIKQFENLFATVDTISSVTLMRSVLRLATPMLMRMRQMTAFKGYWTL
jgi:hypothetical protein